MKCPRCQQDNPIEQKFCGECGTPLEAVGHIDPAAPSYAEVTRALSEALDQQAAMSEILRVISQSPTDAAPVFEVIVKNACRLCDAVIANAIRFDGQLMHNMAQQGFTPEAEEVMRRLFPMKPTRSSMAGRAILSGAVVHTEDVGSDHELLASREFARVLGFRAQVSVPMLRDGVPVGAITVARRSSGLFPERQISMLRGFAAQAVIAVENVRLLKELEARNRELTTALEQQTATSEILRVISSSPTDVQPVFDAIARSAVRLCEGVHSGVLRLSDDVLSVVAHENLSPISADILLSLYPTSPDRAGLVGLAIRQRDVIHSPDVERDPRTAHPELARHAGYSSILAVPILRSGASIGAIFVTSTMAFSATQMELLKTFADQAVIAIENVRLFTELREKNQALTQAHAQVTEALEQQTATSEILRVISSSPTDVQPVFDAIVASAVRLVRGLSSAVYRYDGELVHNVAVSDATPEIRAEYQRWFPRRPRPASIIDRAILERSITHIADIQKASDLLEGARRIAAMRGYHSILVVPMLREGVPIGAISVTRVEAGLFSDKQIALFQTFADQAVIAIENVRLFTELQARNRDLTDALEQQTATAEILRVISQAQTDVQPVFDAIVRNAVRLCGASHGGVYRFDGELVHSAAHDGYTSEQLEHWRRQWPRPVTAASVACQVIRTGRLVRIADLETAAEMHALSSDTLVNLRARGARSVIAVPMFRQHEIVGAISLSHRDVDAFSDAHVELLKTFADQAVIAVENARLLTELQTRTRELTRSVGELTALGDVGRTLSSTLDLETVLQTIVTRANTLAGTAGCTIWEYDDAHGQFHLRVSHYADERDAAILGAPHRVTTIRRGQGVTTQVVERRQPVQIADIALEGAYESPIRGALLEAGHRGLLGVPLLREEQVIGVLAVTRKTPGEFEPDVVRLLSSFATQSALAIQNARLFREIEDKSRQLEIASQHKSEFLANMSHELRTPLNAVIGFSEVLGERMFGELNEKQEEYLKDIHASGQHLLSLINDILDLSKIEAGRMELELTDFNLPATLDNALTLVRERAGRHGIALHITVDERVGQVRADERKIRQVALNLLSNAIKFTPEGGRIDVRAVPDDGGVEVSVSDTGVGIAPEDQEAIFEEFRQVGTAAKKVEGTGLGLALSRRFVELHGGRIWVKSEVGVGSTFSFTIPVRRGE